jgi:hypothetical protein
MTEQCDISTDFLVESFSFTMAYVDPDVPGKHMSENSTQLFSWYWPGDDQSIHQIVTSIIDATILSITNTVIAGLPESSLIIQKL